MTELKKRIIKHYQAFIRDAEIESDLRDALKTNERVPTFLSNLERELMGTRFTVTDSELAMIVRETTKTFLWALKTAKEVKLMSDIKRMELISQYEKRDEIQKLVDSTEVKDGQGKESYRVETL